MRQERLPEFGVYSSFEVELKRKYTRWRGYLLWPLVSLLAWMGVYPDWVSFSGWASALLFYLLGGHVSSTALGVVLVVYILMDNLDGALAEVRGKSEFGQIVDNFFDLTSLLLILLLLCKLSVVPLLWVLVFQAAYTVILVGGFIANFNGLSVLILRVRILVVVPFLVVSFGGLSDSILRYALALGLFLQLLSVVSILFALGVHARGLRIPHVLSRVSLSTRALGFLALVVDVLLLIEALIIFRG